MIEIKAVEEKEVKVTIKELDELREAKKRGIQLYRLMCAWILDRYVENYACFGNGGTVSYEELAKMYHVELPEIEHVGVEKFLEIKRKVNGYGKKESSL